MLHEFSKKDIASYGAQPKGNWIKDKPEDDILRFYVKPIFLFKDRNTVSIS